MTKTPSGAKVPTSRRGLRADGMAVTLPDETIGIPIRVRPQDRRKLEELAGNAGVPLAIAAGVALAAGSRLIRGEETAVHLRHSSAFFLWRCIHRERGEFSEVVPLAEDAEGYLDEARYDARQLGRRLADWGGSLVMIGLEALACAPAVTAMMAEKGVACLIRAAACEAMAGAASGSRLAEAPVPVP